MSSALGDLQEVTSPAAAVCPGAARQPACCKGRQPPGFRPGTRGQAYRAPVIGTRAHTAATTHTAIGPAAEPLAPACTRPPGTSQPPASPQLARALKSPTCRIADGSERARLIIHGGQVDGEVGFVC